MADQPRNLAQLKRACTAGTRLQITNHPRPEISRVTIVTKTSTVDLITRARDRDGKIVEHAHLGWGKAGDWTFDEHGAHHNVVDLVVLGPDETGNRKLPNLTVVPVARKAWANVESEGSPCSVGPFLDSADADHFRALMFSDPDYGDTSTTSTGYPMSVAQFQAAFRADFTTRPPARWHARY